ncbi:MAG: amidohydrolase, partial [Clostridia bacterium]|nr:amidohydrolase [Clostridia bacterium]
YPEKIVEKAVGGTDNFYNVTSNCKGTVEDLIDRGTAAGIDHFVVQSVATTPKQVESINNFIATSVENSCGKFTGLGTLHPDSNNIANDVKQIINLGLRGVKLHPDIQRFKIDDYRCLKIYELCEGEGLPILMHTGDYRYDFSNPNRLLPILKIYTNLTIIGAHLGGWSIWEEASKELCEVPNLMVDCSSTFNYVDIPKVEEIIIRYGEDRVMFATDYPMWAPEKEIDTFLKLNLTDTQREKIFSKNAKNLFNIKL